MVMPDGYAPPLRRHKSRSLPSLTPPGPADYTPSKQLPRSNSGSFTRSTRWKQDDFATPGPAEYRKTARERDRLWGAPRQPPFSQVPRGWGDELLRNPGPADYTPDKLRPGPVAPGSFNRARRWRREEFATPGPDAYRKTKMEGEKLWRQPRQPKFSVVPRLVLESNAHWRTQGPASRAASRAASRGEGQAAGEEAAGRAQSRGRGGGQSRGRASSSFSAAAPPAERWAAQVS